MTEVNQPRTGAFQAVVRAGADETPYQRAGGGQPIVVVSIAAIDDPECQALVFALAACHRVYVPGIRGSPKDFSAWLRLFLDGIGLETVALVAEEALAVPAVSFTALQPDRVRALVVIGTAATDSTAEVSGTPLLTLGRGRTPEGLADLIGRFLAGGPVDLE